MATAKALPFSSLTYAGRGNEAVRTAALPA